MISTIGSFLTGFAALIALYAGIAAWIGQARHENSWKNSADHAGQAVLILLFIAVGFLVGALVTGHFEISYVYNHSANALPLYLKITALWGGQEGSLLFWSFMQALFTVLAVRSQKTKNSESVYIAAAALNLIIFFFAGITFMFQNPFTAISPVPSDGLGLNPLLRHPGDGISSTSAVPRLCWFIGAFCIRDCRNDLGKIFILATAAPPVGYFLLVRPGNGIAAGHALGLCCPGLGRLLGVGSG